VADWLLAGISWISEADAGIELAGGWTCASSPPEIIGAEALPPGVDVQADIRRRMDRIRVRLVRVFKAGSRSTAKKGFLLWMVQVLGQKRKTLLGAASYG
jgi:hypothetical protein